MGIVAGKYAHDGPFIPGQIDALSHTESLESPLSVTSNYHLVEARGKSPAGKEPDFWPDEEGKTGNTAYS
jgi:hypothetical protein